MPDEVLRVIRYTIDPQRDIADKKKPWIWMLKLREYFTGSIGSSQMNDRFKFWHSSQSLQVVRVCLKRSPIWHLATVAKADVNVTS